MLVGLHRKWPVSALMVSLLAASASFGAEPVLLQGFENLAGVKAVRGAKGAPVVLGAVKGKPYVTEGKQAGLLRPGTTVSFAAGPATLAAAQWFKIDTSVLEPLPHPVRIGFSGAGFAATAAAYVQPGTDTLALPLSVMQVKARVPWPAAGVVVSVTNTGRTALIVDNARLEPAAEAPEGSVLVDFGPSGQVVWPGFAAGGEAGGQIRWGSDATHPSGTANWPDPLGRDFVGPALGNRTSDSITLGAGDKGVSAWLWLTHYGPGYMQPMNYKAMFGGKELALEKFSPQEMYGPQTLLEGAGGAWTPQWFDTEYAGQFVRVGQATAGGTRRRVDLENCQLAAVVMAPLTSRLAMSKYVGQVRRDLTRYRRQFVVGATRRVRCGLAPVAVEKLAGMMVFIPPPDRGFSATWVPDDTNRGAGRNTAITTKAAAGMDLVIPLTVVPLRPAKAFSVSPSLLRSATGGILAFDRPGLTAYCVERVPRVLSAAVEFQPWVLVRPARFRAEVGDVCLIILKGRIRKGAQAGIYRGSLTITRAGLRTEVPLSIDVLGFSVDAGADPTIGANHSVGAEDYYHAVAQSLSPAQRIIETAKVRRQLFSSGIDAMRISGVSVSVDGVVESSFFAARVKGYPAEEARGRTLLDATNAAAGIEAGASKMLSIASAGQIKRRYLAWRSRGDIAGKDKPVGAVLAMIEKGSAMLMLSGKALLETTAADASALAPWSALLVSVDTKGLGKGIARFIGAGKKRVYINPWYPDRYLCGFYSCAVGASGSYVYGLSHLGGGGTYSGYAINGRGVLAVQSDGSLAPTMAMVQLWQARSDYQLMKSCQALLASRGAAAPGAAGLAAVLKKIRDVAATQEIPYFNRLLLRNRVVSPATMDAWRAELFEAAAKVIQAGGARRMAPKP